jgi:hypothetical protein
MLSSVAGLKIPASAARSKFAHHVNGSWDWCARRCAREHPVGTQNQPPPRQVRHLPRGPGLTRGLEGRCSIRLSYRRGASLRYTDDRRSGTVQVSSKFCVGLSSRSSAKGRHAPEVHPRYDDPPGEGVPAAVPRVAAQSAGLLPGLPQRLLSHRTT